MNVCSLEPWYIFPTLYIKETIDEDSVAYSKKKYAGGIEFLVVRRLECIGDFGISLEQTKTEVVH
ncbi:hypothetical protein [Leptospira noguchii]|uniref:hypothetical protein n=1 Tax=Leptospira noguchii TaxID=28182 RepID=UPI001FB7ADE3|nr:hypothetical protein [Leptospira noguchii]UOG36325.1 hypothetical protein MAL02_19530 [Leptospira noguchii]